MLFSRCPRPSNLPPALCRMVVACALANSPWLALPVSAESALNSARPVQLNLPAQPLASAVQAISQASGSSIAADGHVLEGRQAPAVQGAYTLLQALTLLLEGTGLVAAEENGVIIIRALPRSSTLTLDAIQVNAGLASQPPIAYSGGQVATGARLGVLGNTDIMDAPFNVTAYTAQHIENQQSGTLGALLRSDPSVRFSTGEGHAYENFMVRGLALNSTELAVNGLYGMAPDGHVPTEFLERVEVLKGPGALLSGMSPGGNVGGLINLVPKRAAPEPLTRLTTRYESEGFVSQHLDVGRRLGDDQQFGIRFNGVYGDGDSGVEDQSKTRNLAALGMDYQGDGWKLDLDAYESHERTDNGSPMMVGFGTLGSVLKTPKNDTNILRGTHSKQITQAMILRGEYELNEQWAVYANVGGGHTRYKGFLNGTRLRVSDTAGNATGETYNQAGYTHSTAGEAGIRGSFATGPVTHEVTLSGSVLHQNIGRADTVTSAGYATNIYTPSRPILAAAPGSADKTGDNTLSSFAATDTLGFLDDRVRLTLGLRAQRVRQQLSNPTYDDQALTPAMGLVVKPWDAAISLYANYIEGLAQGGTVSDTTAANYGEQFAPYKTRQMEVGAKWDLGTFTHTLSLFQIEQPSLMLDQASNRYSDSGEQRNRGVEWNLFGSLTPTVRLLGGATYTRAVLTRTANGQYNGHTAHGVPTWTANLGAEWDTPWVSGLTLTGLVIHTGSQYLDDANNLKIPQWTRYDLGARYGTRLVGKDVTLRASLENVENRSYWAGVFNDGFATIGEPRTLKLSASVDF